MSPVEYYTDLLNQALATLPPRSVMVIGPIGLDELFDSNIARIRSAQAQLCKQGYQVFDQTIYHDVFHLESPKEYGIKFDIFYRGLIASGNIHTCYVMPGWEQSNGTKQEIEFCKQHNVVLCYLQ